MMLIWMVRSYAIGRRSFRTTTLEQAIRRRAQVINTFKEELIRRLNLPFVPEDFMKMCRSSAPV